MKKHLYGHMTTSSPARPPARVTRPQPAAQGTERPLLPLLPPWRPQAR